MYNKNKKDFSHVGSTHSLWADMTQLLRESHLDELDPLLTSIKGTNQMVIMFVTQSKFYVMQISLLEAY